MLALSLRSVQLIAGRYPSLLTVAALRFVRFIDKPIS